MRRILALFGAGVALGAAAMYFARDDGTGAGADASAPAPAARSARKTPERSERTPQPIDFLTLALQPVGTSQRAALFRLAAETDRRTIEGLVRQVAALPNVEGRRLALEALLTRYAEIDAPAAAAFARTLDLPAAALAPLFTTWARSDARAALQALGELDGAAALPLGIAVLEVIGNDGLGVARVLGAAPQIGADRFRIEAAMAKAPNDPAGALEDLLELPPSRASAAFERLAAIWIERDVHEAIAAAAAIADETLRTELSAAVMRTWARVDPDALVDYVVDLDPERRGEALRSPGALQAFAFVDPQRALQAAEGMPGDLGAMMRRAALMSFARDDPLAALSAAEALTGSEREQVLSAIATSYGRTDPEAALAWAQSLSPPSPSIVANVLAGLARVDPDRAIDLLFATMEASGQRGAGPFMALVANGALGAEHTAKLAERLLATPNRGPALQMMTQMWAQREPHDAVRWLLANGSAAPRTALGQAAMQLARKDPAAAVAYINSVPPELRATWLSSVAEGYAQNDARAAAELDCAASRRARLRRRRCGHRRQNRRQRSVRRGAAIRLHQHRGGARRAASVAAHRQRLGPAGPPRGRGLGSHDHRRRSSRRRRCRGRGAMGRARCSRRARLDARPPGRAGTRPRLDATSRHDDEHRRSAARRCVQQSGSAAARHWRCRAHHLRERSGRSTARRGPVPHRSRGAPSR